MGKFHKLRNNIGLLLSFSLLLNLNSTLILAAEASPAPHLPSTYNQKNDSSFPTKPTSPQEIVDARTENSKRFLNPDGTYTEKIYNAPVHYKDANGKWATIDSTLETDSKGKFHNKANRFAVDLPQAANDEFIHYAEDGTSLAFRPVFAGKSQGKSQKNKLDYTDVTTDTDLQYSVLNNGLKESLILKSTKSPTSFSFEINMENLTYQTQKDGTIQFYKTGESTPLLTLAKPYLEDAKHKTSDNVTYNIRKDDTGKTFLDVQADATWLQDPSRVFPVVLDPTTYSAKDSTNFQDTFVEEKFPDSPRDYYQHNLVGHGDNHGITRAMYWFTLPQLPDSAVVSNATFNVVNELIDQPTQTPTVEVHRINSNWYPSTVTWNLEKTMSIGGVDSTYQVTNSDPDWWKIPMTSLVQSWYNGTQQNFGFELRYQNETTDVLRQLIGSGDPTYPPYLQIDYSIDGLGMQSFWTYDGPVNMANLNFVNEVTDATFAGRGVSLTTKRTYNNRSSNVGIFGTSWNTLLDTHLYMPYKGNARMIDPERTVHYFRQNADLSYEPLPGLYWKLSASGGAGTITTPSQTKYIFNTSGQLTKIQDANNNTLTLTYSSTQDTIQDSAGHKLIFTLTNGLVSSVTDPAGKVWKYTYDSASNLIKVTSPDASVTTQYRYDSHHNMIAQVSPSGKTIYYQYSSDDRMVAIHPINMISNGNFEVDADGSGIPDHFNYDSGYGGLTIDKSSGSSYGHAVKIDSSSANSAAYTNYISDSIPVEPTKQYMLSTYQKATQTSGTQTSVYGLYAYDTNGNLLGEVGRSAATGTFDWKRSSTTVGAGTSNPFPSGTVSVKVKVAASNTTGTGQSWFDAIQLEEGNAVSDFVSGTQYTSDPSTKKAAAYDGEGHKTLYSYNEDQNLTQQVQDPDFLGATGLKLTDSYDWTSDTINSHTDENSHTSSYQHDENGNVIESTDALNQKQNYSYDSANNLTQYVGTKQNASDTYLYTYDDGRNQLTSRDPYYTSKAETYDAYGHLLTGTTPLGWADNLVDNSSFENGVQSSGIPVAYLLNNGQQSAAISNASVYGSNSVTLSPNAGYTVLTTNNISIDKNSDYVLAGYVKADETSGSQNTVLSLYAYDSTGNTNLGEIGKLSFTGEQSTWQRFATAIHPSDFPANTAYVRVKIGSSNTVGTGTSYFDALQFQKNPVDTAYNLLDNSSFERGSSWPDHWKKLNTASSYVWSTSTYYAGTRSFALNNPASGDGVTYDQYLKYDSSKAYNLSAIVHTMGLSANIAAMRIDEFDANKALLGSVVSSPYGGDTNWKRMAVQLDSTNVKTGTVYIKPVFYASGAATGNLHFDNVRLQSDQVMTTNTYDSTSTWLKSKKDPLGRLVQYGYDSSGNVTSITDAMNHVTTLQYDALNRLTDTTPPGNDVKVHNDYDVDGNLTQIANLNPADGSTITSTKFTYNKTGELQSEQDALHRQETFSYTPNGKLQQVTTLDADGNDANLSVSMKYDNVNRMTDMYYNSVNQYSFGYDHANLTSVKDNVNNVTWTSTYDELNRLTKWNDGKANVSYTYDAKNNITKRSIVVGSAAARNQTFTYDNVSEPISMTDIDGMSKFVYNELGKPSIIQSGNGQTERLTYDSAGQVVQVQNTDVNGSLLSTFQVSYDKNGNLTSIKDVDSNTLNSYTYDIKNRLTSETLPDGTKKTYSYDSLGNRTLLQVVNPDNTSQTTTYTYDAANQLTKVDNTSYTYDARGHLLSNGTFNYTWDAGGRLTKAVKISDGSTVTYQYDSQNRRTRKTVGDVTTGFLYDGGSNHVVAEYDVATGAVTKSYTWSPSGNLLSMTEGGVTYYTVRNSHGDIIKLITSDGKEQASYSYDAFGVTSTSTDKVATDNPYRYADYRYDEETGLYYLIGRYYDPTTGHFISEDPASKESNYLYASNNPTVFVDPSGYMREYENTICSKCMQSHISDYSTSSDFENAGYSMPETTRQDAEILVATYTVVLTAGAIALTAAPAVLGAGLAEGGVALEGFKASEDAAAESEAASISQQGLNFSGTTVSRMESPGRHVPVQILKQAIKHGVAETDPQGTDAMMYYTRMFKNGKEYNLEVLYNNSSNTIFHFKYSSKALGPLSAITK